MPFLSVKILAILLLAGLLTVSVIVGFKLVGFAKHYYQLFNRTQLDPLGLLVYQGESAVDDKSLNKKRVVFWGDSRAFQWPVPELSFSSESVLSRNTVRFYNRGINGQTSAQIMGRYEQDLEPLEADIVVVHFCVNDLKTIGLFEDANAFLLSQCQQRMIRLIDLVRDSGGQLVITTLFPYSKVPLFRSWAWSPEIEKATLEFNQFLMSLEGEGVTVLDAHKLLVAEDGRIKPEFSQDLLHLNSRGYQQLNQALGPVLVEMLESSDSVSDEDTHAEQPEFEATDGPLIESTD